MIKAKPIGSKWTDDQWKAVCIQTQNVLVSAGAGSGKTAVLTERIIEHIKSGVDVRSLVVLTFTNAAAREMRERVQKALKLAAKDDPSLNQQLELIDLAHITTFDAYSQFMLKKYHYLLNIDNNFTIIDNTILAKLKYEVIDEIFENEYAKKNEDFIKLIDTYTIMNDNELKDQVSFLMDKLSNQIVEYDHMKYLNIHLFDQAVTDYEQEIMQLISQIKDNAAKLCQMIDDEKFMDYGSLVYEHYSGMFAANDYFELKKYLVETPAFKKQVPRAKHDLKADYKQVNDEIKKLFSQVNEMCEYESKDEMIEELKQANYYSAVIVRLAKFANEKLMQKKLEKNSYEFIDISKLAIKIFEEFEDVRNEVGSEIYEILLDEYQDTNDIQEYFIDLIASNNVYMVGDIKQAIYGFRNANPDNFATKYLNYSKQNGGTLIDLNKNFRSREEVLANINTVFDPLMCQEIGGIDYVGKQRLVYGNKMYETKHQGQNQHMEIISYEVDDTYLKKEQEARLIASDIVEKINNHYQVLDKGHLRDATFKDFAILCSTKSSFSLYKKIFEEYQIPIEVQSTINDDTEDEVYVINALFKLLYTLETSQANQEYFKFNFLSLCRSYLFDFDDYQTSKVVSEARSLYDVLKLENEYSQVAKVICDIHDYYQTYNLASTLTYAIEQLNIIKYAYRLENVHNSEAKIRQMVELFMRFDSENYQIYDIVEYLEELRLKNSSIELMDAQISSDDVTQMMTIHKSKGLEFNVVYFPELSGKFNVSDTTKKEIMTKNYGYIYPVVKDYEVKKTIFHTLNKLNENKEIISEQIRLFYVALTRAKDKMIMLSDSEFKKTLPISKMEVKTKKSFNKFVDFLVHNEGNLYEYNASLMLEDINYDNELNFQNKAEIEFEVPQLEYENINLETKTIKQKRASMSKFSLINVKQKTNMQLGTDYHNVLEIIDFTQDIKKQVLDLEPKFQKIVNEVANLDILKNAVKTYNEYQFIYQNKGMEIVGIIDLLIETDNELIVLDYKLDDVHKKEYEEQINTYVEYVKTKTTKNVSGYLYSLVKKELKKVR